MFAVDAGPHGDGAALGHGVDRVEDQVRQHLADGGGLAQDHRHRFHVAHDLDVHAAALGLALPARLGECGGLLEAAADVHRGVRRALAALAVEVAQAADDRGGVAGGRVDQLDVLLGRLARQIGAPHQQLGEADDRRQGVVEVVGDAAGHLPHRAQPLLLEDLPLGGLELGQRVLELPVAALQLGLRAVALGDVVEAHHDAHQVVALDHGRGHVVDGQVAAVDPAEDLVDALPRPPVLERREHRRALVGRRPAVGIEAPHDGGDRLARDVPDVDAEQLGGGRVDEGDPALGVHAEDALAGRFENQRRLREGALVEPPRHHAAHAGAEDEEGVDAGPRPWRVVGSLVVVDGLGPQDADHSVVEGHEGDGQQVRDPVLAEREEREHHEEVEVQLDHAAREVHQDGRRAEQAEADRGGLDRPAEPAPARDQREGRHDRALPDRVQRVVVFHERLQTELPAPAEHGPHQRDDDRVEPGEPDEEAEARAPHVLGQRATGRHHFPETLEERVHDAHRGRPDGVVGMHG